MWILKIASRLSLAATIAMSGLMVCIFFPFTTEALSKLTSTGSTFGVSADVMARAALATRDYALGLIGSEGLKNSLETIGLPSNGLDTLMLSHLKDCTPIFEGVRQLFLILLVISAILIILTGIFGRKKGLSNLLLHSSLLAIVVIVAFGMWVSFSFNSFFTWMHSLFFASGTWTFAADSLLICMFPQNFWIGMGVVWACVSIVISLCLIFVSRKLSK